MHQPILEDILARVVSFKLAGNETEYSFQEDCGTSDIASYFKLRKQSNIHETIVVGVYTLVTSDDFEATLLNRKVDQNIAFLKEAAARKLHPLCPVIAAAGEPSDRFPFHWIAYDHVDGWQLASNWHQLKSTTRNQVIYDLAIFVRELASIHKPIDLSSKVSVDYVGSTKANHLLYPPVLVDNTVYWLGDQELEAVQSHADLVGVLARARVAMLKLRASDNAVKSLAADQLESLIPIVTTLLDQPSTNVLAHLNLLPQNIWIDTITGKITAIFGWELAHYAPTWMVTAPLPWLLDEKVDPILESEVAGDPWSVWRPRFLHPPQCTGKELRNLRMTWEETLRFAGADHHPLSKATLLGDIIQRRALRACFMEERKLGISVEWVYESVIPEWRQYPLIFSTAMLLAVALIGRYPLHFSPSTTNGLLARLIVGCAVISAILYGFSYYNPSSTSGPNIKLGFKTSLTLVSPLMKILLRSRFPSIFGYSVHGEAATPLMAIHCSPANSIIPDAVYLPGLLSRGPSTRGMPIH